MATTQMQQYPVSADFHGGDSWSSPGISFDDYSRMYVQTRKPSGERRLPTPSWAVNFREQRELLVAFLERRAMHRTLQDAPLDVRLAMAQATIVSRCRDLVKLLDRMCHEYVTLKRTNPRAPRLHKLQIQIELNDTRIRMEQRDGGLGVVARIIHLYYGCCLDSVGVAAELGIKPPMVRRTLFKLAEVWAVVNGTAKEHEATVAARAAAWNKNNPAYKPKVKRKTGEWGGKPALVLNNCQFGRLLVTSRAEKHVSGHSWWNCTCQCGNTCVKRGVVLIHSSPTISCGHCTTKVATIKPAKVKPTCGVLLTRADKLPEQLIVKLYRAGWNLADIARQVGTGPQPCGRGMRCARIRNVLKRAGVYRSAR